MEPRQRALLYVPGCTVSASPCPSANRVAINPATGASLGANSTVAIGTLVANSGNVTNGLIQAGQGIAKENYTWPWLAVTPRIGAAYDLTGTQKMVLRGNFGMFFDRPENNMSANQIGNPPNSTATTVRYAQLQALGSGGLTTRAPAQLLIYQYDSKLPTALQWSTGVQMMLPWSSSLDVSYVGSHGYNLVNQFNQPIDINSVDLGAAFLPQNQDPTQSSATPGAAALTTDLLRPFPGYGAINMQWGRFWNDFHSIQSAFNRRFRDGLSFGLNYTVTLRQAGTNDLNSVDSVRLVHNPDGTFSDDPVWAQAQENLDNNGLRRHVIKGNFVWDLPDIHSTSTSLKALGFVLNDWQLSGILPPDRATRSATPIRTAVQREPDRLPNHAAHPHRRRPARAAATINTAPTSALSPAAHRRRGSSRRNPCGARQDLT